MKECPECGEDKNVWVLLDNMAYYCTECEWEGKPYGADMAEEHP